ncbi:hypothetical protein ENUP19_0085G0018 [Entamoeba nuttalli]|uniref:Uncharacterized protein n=2 Tax=Entamoeba nuttalli TaxID=412467 RepID=K2H599_ENTNP|nr:hypothetical protein ENU1_051030 [Entamoeba nuttalli P19]EKE41577.1 hypothetical protein ENU1_051030 [Entamoeba nuttalli P19]|eukprot:XP_008856086.1 hypothetical protein ENU1_051030 [Entamoeba nuttalli P19]
MNQRHKEKFQAFRNYQTQQQTFLLALLNKNCSITISKPFKTSKVCLQFFKIETLKFSDTDIIQFESFVSQRCKQREKFDMKNGISEKTARRRSESNKRIISLGLMKDILTEHGAVFETERTSGKNGALVIETICSVNIDGKQFSKSDIERIAQTIYTLLIRRMRLCSFLILTKNDDEIQQKLQ